VLWCQGSVEALRVKPKSWRKKEGGEEDEDGEDASIHTILANTGRGEGKKDRRRKKFDGIKGRDYLPQY
jgi:hypothetical protein